MSGQSDEIDGEPALAIPKPAPSFRQPVPETSKHWEHQTMNEADQSNVDLPTAVTDAEGVPALAWSN